jgi:hypothetical protein
MHERVVIFQTISTGSVMYLGEKREGPSAS